MFVESTSFTLQDDDHELTLSAAPATIKEDGGVKRITVTARVTDPPRKDITLLLRSLNPTAYTLSKTSLGIDIDAADSSGTASFEITPVDDNVFNGDVEIDITLDSSSNNLVVRGPAKVTLQDDEKLPGLDLAVSPERIGEGGGTRRVTVTATLEEGVLLPTSTRVAVSISEDSDQYALSTGALAITIPAGGIRELLVLMSRR